MSMSDQHSSYPSTRPTDPGSPTCSSSPQLKACHSKILVMTVVGTWPEIIRLSRMMATLDQHLDHVIVHIDQNYDYELNQILFDDLELREPDYFLNSAKQGNSDSDTVGTVISNVDKVLAEEKPGAFLVLGDTNSCLAAYPAKLRQIFDFHFHVETGNRCFDQHVPEDINRCIVDHTIDINLPYNHISREYLLHEG